jgi:DNA-binding NarL/FixJ family response regulator
MPERIRVLLADDHPMVRAALASFFDAVDDVEVIGVAEDGRAAVELTPTLRPDVVLMDYSMPKMNGAEATRRIVSEWPQVRVVGLSMHGAELGEQMVEAGAVCCLSKGADLGGIVEAIRDAAESPGTRFRP